MGLYKPKGSKVWYFTYTHQKKRTRQCTGATNKKTAQKIFDEVRNQIANGLYVPPSKREDRTLEEALERYLEEVTPSKKSATQRDDKTYAKNLSRIFRKMLLKDISTDAISKYVLKRRENVGPCTVNRELSFLSAMFNRAIKIWDWCKDNPVSRIKREKEPKRTKYFSEEEFSKIFKFLPDWLRPIVLLAKNTGLRQANLVNLKWSRVKLSQRLIFLEGEQMKNGEPICLPLNDVAFDVLQTLWEKKMKAKSNKRNKSFKRSSFVFCHSSTGGSYSCWGVSRGFKKACVRAKLKDFRFHDLRHDFCSQLVQSGVNLYVVKELAGHKDITTTQRYAHLNLDNLKDAVGMLNG